MNSAVAQGQSLGKRMLTIRVLGSDGRPIPLKISLLRAALVGFPLFWHQFGSSSALAQSSFGTALSLSAIAVGGTIACVFWVNWPTHQALHDLLFRTYVVRERVTGSFATHAARRNPYLVMGVCILLGLALVSLPTYKKSVESAQRLAVQRQLLAQPHVYGAVVYEDEVVVNFTANRIVKAQLITKKFMPPEATARYARKVADILLKQYPHIDTFDYIAISIGTGYDIGFSTLSWREVQYFATKKNPEHLMVNTEEQEVGAFGIYGLSSGVSGM